MAALTPTYLTGKLPIGRRVIRVIRFTISNANAPDEWIDTGLSWIDGVIGCVAVARTADDAETPGFKKNCGATDGTADGTQGDENTATAGAGGILAVEGNAGAWEVTVIGKA